jgi:hypothetical protein
MATKQGILNFLQNKMDSVPKGHIRYYTIGALYILVSKDVITVADIEARFPELA